MPQDVWGDFLAREAGAGGGCGGGVLVQAGRDGVAAHSGACPGGEQVTVRCCSFGDEHAQHGDGFPVQRGASVFASFAVAEGVCPGSEVDVGDLQAGQFGDPHAGG